MNPPFGEPVPETKAYLKSSYRAGEKELALAFVQRESKSWRPTPGALIDRTAVKGEHEGTRALFAGAYAVLRNPSGHREVNYNEAAEAVVLASLLMRILDRIEKRLQT